MHKIEKELTGVIKVKREDGESDQEFFTKLVTEGEKSFGKDESLWGKLSEGTQRWYNAAAEASEGGKTVPNYNGEIVEAEAEAEEDGEPTAEDKAEEAAERVQVAAEEPKKKKAKAPKEKAPPKKAAAKAEKEKPAKAEKKAKANGSESAVKSTRGRKGSFSPSDKIKKVAAKNPFREGSKAAKCYGEYKVGRTVQQVLDAGVPRSKLNRHMNKGVVTIG